MRSRSRNPVRLGVLALALTVGWGLLPVTALASPPQVSHERFEFSHVVTDTNICGDLGVFRFAGMQTVTEIGFSNGAFHYTLVERGRYTLTFLEEPGGIWESRFVESITFHAPPSGSFVLHVAFNSFEGPIRIHETTRFVIGPDGTIRVDDQDMVVDECPPA